MNKSGQMESYFTNLDFPEIFGDFPEPSATEIGGNRSRDVAMIWSDKCMILDDSGYVSFHFWILLPQLLELQKFMSHKGELFQPPPPVSLGGYTLEV